MGDGEDKKPVHVLGTMTTHQKSLHVSTITDANESGEKSPALHE